MFCSDSVNHKSKENMILLHLLPLPLQVILNIRSILALASTTAKGHNSGLTINLYIFIFSIHNRFEWILVSQHRIDVPL